MGMASRFVKIKNKFHFEKNVPRCETCINFQESKIMMTTYSRTVRLNHHCKVHGFSITKTALCDAWQSEKGEVLEPLQAKVKAK